MVVPVAVVVAALAMVVALRCLVAAVVAKMVGWYSSIYLW